MVREFRIVGQKTGKEYSLNDFNKYLLTLPTGLGFKYNNEFITVGSKRIKVSSEREFENFTGTIEVAGATKDDWEKNYNELRDFISANKSSGFRLYYKNRQQGERYIYCDINVLEKTEKSSYAILVPVEFEPKSLWLNDVTFSTEATSIEVENNTMSFMQDTYFSGDYQYNYGFLLDETLQQYDYSFITNPVGEADVVNNSDEETPMEIIIYGECVNPYIQMIDVNGNVVQSARIYVSLTDNDSLTINSDPENLSIIVTRGDETEDITTDIDTSLVNFMT